jgi:hypothetical protein
MQQQMQQQIFSGMEVANTPVQPQPVRPIPTGPTSLTGPTGPSFRGRPVALGPRGRGGFPQRGGRGKSPTRHLQRTSLTLFHQWGKHQYDQHHLCRPTCRRVLEIKTNTRTEMDLLPMSTDWIMAAAAAGGMLTATRRQRRDHGKYPVTRTFLAASVKVEFRKRRASPVLEDSRSKRR